MKLRMSFPDSKISEATMTIRKQNVLGHDLRLDVDHKLVQQDGERRLRVEAQAPSAK
jgi:hypothetical protein